MEYKIALSHILSLKNPKVVVRIKHHPPKPGYGREGCVIIQSKQSANLRWHKSCFDIVKNRSACSSDPETPLKSRVIIKSLRSTILSSLD